MTLLDASNLNDESDLAVLDEPKTEEAAELNTMVEEHFDREDAKKENGDAIRTITLAVPPELETTIKLFIQHGADNRYRGIAEVQRHYDCNPYEQQNEPTPFDDVQGDAQLGQAIIETADVAAFWLSSNCDDDDERTKKLLDWLDQWYNSFDISAANDLSFDPLPALEPVQTASEPTPEAVQPVADPVPVAVKPFDNQASLSKAVADFEEQKHEMQEEMCNLMGEIEILDATRKGKKSRLSEISKQYHQHCARGPEHLPLIDNAKTPEPSPIEPVSSEPETAAPVAAPVAADDESWRQVLIQVTSIPTAIIKILNEDNQIYTLGQLADVTSEPNTALTDLKKIGQAKAEKIEEAMAEYWAANPRE